MPAFQKLDPEARTDTAFQQAEGTSVTIQASRLGTVNHTRHVKIEYVPTSSVEKAPQRSFGKNPEVRGIVVGFTWIKKISQRLIFYGCAARCLLSNAGAEQTVARSRCHHFQYI